MLRDRILSLQFCEAELGKILRTQSVPWGSIWLGYDAVVDALKSARRELRRMDATRVEDARLFNE